MSPVWRGGREWQSHVSLSDVVPEVVRVSAYRIGHQAMNEGAKTFILFLVALAVVECAMKLAKRLFKRRWEKMRAGTDTKV